MAHVNKPDVFHPNDPGGLTYANSDLAFGGHYVYQGNFSGIQIWDIANPAKPVLTNHLLCFTEQGDVSVYGHLLFVSAENSGSRLDCGTQGIKDSVSKERMLGIRIFDISDPASTRSRWPTCRPAAGRTPTRSSPTRTTRASSTCTCPGWRRCGRRREMAGCEVGDITDPNIGAVPHRGDSRPAGAPGAGRRS